MITARGSWAHGLLKSAARKNFKIFKFKEGSTKGIKWYNQELQVSLLCDNAFHHKVCTCLVIRSVLMQFQNYKEIMGFGEHPIIINILRDMLFEDARSYGVKYSRYFDPISVNLLALVFMMVGRLAAVAISLNSRNLDRSSF